MSTLPMAALSREKTASIKGGDALPWPLIGAVLAAMAALYFSSERFIGLPVLAVLLVFSRFSNSRLPNYFVITYGSRAVILAVLLTLINQANGQDSTVWYLKQEDTNLAGYAVAADLVLRAWSRRDAAGAREGLGVVVLMTALLFAAATNTYERLHIQIITPIYAILLLLSFRFFAVMQQPAAPRAKRPALVLLRATVIFTTLAVAFAAVYAVTRYEYQVTNWAMQFVRQHHGQQHDIGFSATPRLANIFNPEPSMSRVLLIDGPIGDPHFRLAAFDTYQRDQWLPAVSDRAFVPIGQPLRTKRFGTHSLAIARLGDTADLVAAPLTSVSVASDDPFEQDDSGTLRDTRSASLLPYSLLVADSQEFLGMVAVKPDAKRRQRLLTIPSEIDPRVIELARLVAGNGEPARQMFRIQEYLRAHHAYSLSFESRGDEPLNDFILNDRAAHCQYFASAVVMMGRAIGVPSRYVGGFYAHEAYGTDQTVVRQRDAHAWAECWLDGTGWVTIDATPSAGRPDGVFADPSALRRWWEKLSDMPGQIRDWFTGNTPLLKKLAVAVATIGLGVGIIKLALRRRLVAPINAPYCGPNAQLVELAQRYERWMKARGFPCPPGATWRAHLVNPKDAEPIVARPAGAELQLCDNFVRTYDRARFGFDEGESAAKARELLTEIERG